MIAACLRCNRAVALVACHGPVEPGWVYVADTGYECPDCNPRWEQVRARAAEEEAARREVRAMELEHRLVD